MALPPPPCQAPVMRFWGGGSDLETTASAGCTIGLILDILVDRLVLIGDTLPVLIRALGRRPQQTRRRRCLPPAPWGPFPSAPPFWAPPSAAPSAAALPFGHYCAVSPRGAPLGSPVVELIAWGCNERR